MKPLERPSRDSFGEKAKNVSLEVSMPEIELDVDTAIPIGLITNELITNSLRNMHFRSTGWQNFHYFKSGKKWFVYIANR
ncbi:MAG: hypothetical protein R2788_01840 [Saprospiraceae bacterium]